MIELSERNVLDLAIIITKERGSPFYDKQSASAYFNALPFSFQNLIAEACAHSYTKENNLPFIKEGGTFNIGRAATTFLIGSLRVDKSLSRYSGVRWDYKVNKYIPNPRLKDFDYLFNEVREHGVFNEFLSEVISRAGVHRANTNCRRGLVGWIVDSQIEIDEDIIKLILKGYFKGDEKAIIMKALIERGELAKLEVFWKSRALAVQKILVETAPLEKLPFMLGTKNQKLLDLIDKRLMEQ